MKSLDAWLQAIQQMHPVEIELGLDRIRTVAERVLSGEPWKCFTITVAGTNGKGSVCHALAALARTQGVSCGLYTSPHLLHFSERIQLDGQPVTDAQLVDAFEAVERGRDGVALTYFEFTTLAALWLFRQARPQCLVLETGLGGRLDAVNIVDSDLAVLTTVDLDHMDWLGPDRESIGREKAGIFRAGKIVLLGEISPPQSVLKKAAELGCRVFRLDHHFRMQCHDRSPTLSDIGRPAVWHGKDCVGSDLTIPIGSLPPIVAANLATAVQAWCLSPFSAKTAAVDQALSQLRVPGRLTRLAEHPETWADVGHNPQAARTLRQFLEARQANSGLRWIAVWSALADKPLPAIVAELAPVMDHWCIWSLEAPRAASIESLRAAIGENSCSVHERYEEAMEAAIMRAGWTNAPCGVLVFGSFLVVSEALQSAGVGLIDP